MDRKQKKLIDDSSDSDCDSKLWIQKTGSGYSPRHMPFIPSKIENIRLAESFKMKGRDQEIEAENRTKRVETVRKTLDSKLMLRKSYEEDEDSEIEERNILNRVPKKEVNIYKRPQPRLQVPLRNQPSVDTSDSEEDSEVVQRGSRKRLDTDSSSSDDKKQRSVRGYQSNTSEEVEKAQKKEEIKKTGEWIRAEEESSDQDAEKSGKQSINIQQLMEQKAKYVIPLDSSLSIKPSQLPKDPELIYNSKPIGFESKESIVKEHSSTDSDALPFQKAKTLKKNEDQVVRPVQEVKLPPHVNCQISQEESVYSSTGVASNSQGASSRQVERVFECYSGPEVEYVSYQIPRFYKSYKFGDDIIILNCGHLMKESDVRIYEIEPGIIKCPICQALTRIESPSRLMKVSNEKMLRNLEKIKEFSKKANQCQMEDCERGKNPKYAYIIGKNKVICKDCIFKREAEKLAVELRKHRDFFLSKAEILAKQREKIHIQNGELKKFSSLQTKVVSQKMLELQQRIEQNLEKQLKVLSEGKNSYLGELQHAEDNVKEQHQILVTRRDQLKGILNELKRNPKEIPSEVKVALDVNRKMGKCRSLLDGDRIAEKQSYKCPELQEDLDYEGLLDYEVHQHKINLSEAIWNVYIGDLNTTAMSYEIFKKTHKQIEESAV